MTRFHRDIHGEPVPCPAKKKCRADSGAVDENGNVEHYEGDLEGAREWAEQKNKEEAGGTNMPATRTRNGDDVAEGGDTGGEMSQEQAKELLSKNLAEQIEEQNASPASPETVKIRREMEEEKRRVDAGEPLNADSDYGISIQAVTAKYRMAAKDRAQRIGKFEEENAMDDPEYDRLKEESRVIRARLSDYEKTLEARKKLTDPNAPSRLAVRMDAVSVSAGDIAEGPNVKGNYVDEEEARKGYRRDLDQKIAQQKAAGASPLIVASLEDEAYRVDNNQPLGAPEDSAYVALLKNENIEAREAGQEAAMMYEEERANAARAYETLNEVSEDDEALGLFKHNVRNELEKAENHKEEFENLVITSEDTKNLFQARLNMS